MPEEFASFAFYSTLNDVANRSLPGGVYLLVPTFFFCFLKKRSRTHIVLTTFLEFINPTSLLQHDFNISKSLY